MAGDEVKAEEPTPAAAEESDLVESSSAPEITARLPQVCVDWILNKKWVAFEEDPDEEYNRMINDPDRPAFYTQEYLEEERNMMRELVAHNKRAGDRFEKFQEFMRSQLEEKGFVEVGQSYIAHCVRNRRSMPAEQWRSLMGGLMDELRLDERDDDGRLVVNPSAGGGIIIE